MRRANIVNLFYYLYRTSGGFNSSFCFFAGGIHFKNEFTFQFAVTQNLYTISLACNVTLTVLVPPIQILGAGTSFSAPGHFTLNFLGDPGGVFAIEASTNLVNWTQLGTVTNATGLAQYDDATSGGSAYRFYRLRLLP